MKFLVEYLYRVLAHSGCSLKDKLPGEDKTLGEALMAPTVIYVKQVLINHSLHYHHLKFKIPFLFLIYIYNFSC